jgi:hypothetical protein
LHAAIDERPVEFRVQLNLQRRGRLVFSRPGGYIEADRSPFLLVRSAAGQAAFDGLLGEERRCVLSRRHGSLCSLVLR